MQFLKRKRVWIPLSVVGVLALMVIIGGAIGEGESATVSPQPERDYATRQPSRDVAPKTSFGNGKHLVGKDIQPGTYRER